MIYLNESECGDKAGRRKDYAKHKAGYLDPAENSAQ